MDDHQPRVVIVLSTFNGERYLNEQMNSLFRQTYKNIEIIVRDDGSSDRTVEILEGLAHNHENVSVLSDRNIGVVGSFLQLLNMVPPNVGFVALCDQDDVWGAEKVERAVGMLGEVAPDRPAMYCSALEVVDENLNPIRVEMPVKRSPSLKNALAQNVATGCTTMINRAALQLVTSRTVSASEILMHDWWLYQVISAFGAVLFDDMPTIQYRQHSGNVIGTSSGIQLWMNRLKRQFGPNRKAIRHQANELLHVYGSDMCTKNYRLISEFLMRTAESGIGGRFVYALRTPVYRQSRIDNLVFRAQIVLSRI